MKKYLIILAAITLLNSGVWADSNLSGAKITSFTAGQDTSNATATIVAAATGFTNNLFKLSFVINAADTVTLKCGSTVKGTWEFTTAGGLDQTIYPLVVSCLPSEALTLTKGTAGNHIYWQAWYTQELD